MTRHFLLVTICLLFLCNLLQAMSYTVEFRGVSDPALLILLQEASQLIFLKNSPPTTNVGLRRRAESDLGNIVKALHSQALYNARVTIDTNFEEEVALVIVNIDPGPVYPLEEFLILPDPKAKSWSFSSASVDTADLGVALGEPAFTKTIIRAEENLELLLEERGFPYATVTRREVLADQESKTISVALFVDSGPQLRFGEASIVGNCRVKRSFFRRKILFSRGELFSTKKLQCTQDNLQLTGLFSSVALSLPEEPPDEEGEVPVTIEVKEGKPRSVGFGINYETNRGPGFSMSWEHRNLKGMGDALSFTGDFWFDKQFARGSYVIGDFCRRGQRLIWAADYIRERDVGYHKKSYSLGATLAREVGCYLHLSYGIMAQHLINTDIHEKKQHQLQKSDDETFNLIKCPLSLYWNRSNSVVDPTRGYKLRYHNTPSYNFLGSQIIYDTNLLRASLYIPLDPNMRFVIAAQATCGVILGPEKEHIPRSELFDAGTDKLLRGYRYKSVSPLDNTDTPTGGRSMMIYSFEYRIRQSNDIGWILFWDFGNVYSKPLPNLNNKILHSVGVGFRYFTPVGPLRLDIGFPLNRRRHVDKSRYQAYLSFGQSF